MNTEIDRRTFLKISIGAASGAFLFGIREAYAKEPPALDFPHVRDFALRMDRIYDTLPNYHVDMSGERLGQWVKEVVPYFEGAGFIDKALYPDKEQLADIAQKLQDAGEALNTLGVTTCEPVSEYSSVVKRTVFLNERFNNPVSILFQSRSALEVLTHELAHVQQGKKCKLNFLIEKELETSAQIATPEVLASMGMGGNKLAIFSFVNVMEEMSMNAAKYLALGDKRLMPQYQWLVSAVYSKPLEQARLALVDRLVRGYEDEHKLNLQEYNYDPLNALLTAHQYTGDKVSGLQFPHATVVVENFGYLLDRHHLESIVHEMVTS